MENFILAMENEIDQSMALHENVKKVAGDITASGEFKLSHALELDNAIANLGAVTAFFESTKSRNQISSEGIILSFFNAIGKVIEAILKMIGKFISWLLNSGGSTEKAAEVKDAVKDISRDVDLSVLDQGVSASLEALVLERDNEINIPIKSIFDKWNNSLTDQEVDFITSGRRYNSIQNVLHHFSNSQLPVFISSISADMQTWMKDGFDKAKHVGKDEEVVNAFVRGKKNEFEKIKSGYSKVFYSIDQMEGEAKMDEVQGVHTRLEFFLKKPSQLFPHLEKIWQSIDFKRVGDEEKTLIKDLEKTRRTFESSVSTLKNSLGLGDSEWPAIESFSRSAHAAYREIAKHISTLAHVCLFIRRSADIAYKATVKSFIYIRNIMNAISKVPTVDHEKLIKAHDAIKRKFDELDSMMIVSA